MHSNACGFFGFFFFFFRHIKLICGCFVVTNYCNMRRWVLYLNLKKTTPYFLSSSIFFFFLSSGQFIPQVKNYFRSHIKKKKTHTYTYICVCMCVCVYT